MFPEHVLRFLDHPSQKNKMARYLTMPQPCPRTNCVDHKHQSLVRCCSTAFNILHIKEKACLPHLKNFDKGVKSCSNAANPGKSVAKTNDHENVSLRRTCVSLVSLLACSSSMQEKSFIKLRTADIHRIIVPK